MSDSHVPAYGVVGFDGATGFVGVTGVVGARILVLLSTAHAVENIDAAARVASSKRTLFMFFVDAAGPFKHDYKVVRAGTELCVQRPAILGNRRISASRL